MKTQSKIIVYVLAPVILLVFGMTACKDVVGDLDKSGPDALKAPTVTGQFGGGMAASFDGFIEWDGRQGLDSERCGYVGEGPRTDAGWIHFVLTGNNSGVTAAVLVLGGTGSGEYMPRETLPTNGSLQFFTPFFELDGLMAQVNYAGTAPGQLVISDYCPGTGRSLAVSKTVVTSFTRTHEWDIDKKVETENEYLLNGYAKVWLFIDGEGDEKATWTVDVTYEGYEDSDWNVSGTITIENIGTSAKSITSVVDVLGGTTITANCGVTFPYSLAMGATLTCTYDEDGYFVGNNVVTVTVDGEDDPYSATEPIVWGAPTTELYATVNIKDISDLFGDVDLGTVTAPNGDSFTYYKEFAWADFGADNCGGFTYENTASIVETDQDADATLKVNVQCFIYDSAWAEGTGIGVTAFPFCDNGFSNWGWSNLIGPGTYEWPLWAGAAQCDPDKGTLVGSVEVVYAGGNVVVTFHVEDNIDLNETHVYAGRDMFPKTRQGRNTVAPGQYVNNSPFINGANVYVIAHGVVGYPDPNFGP
jgi:hypothetical protein